MRHHHISRLLTCSALVMFGTAVVAQTMLNPDEVRGIAVSALMGDPYGQDSATVLANIANVTHGPDPICGGGTVWIVSVYVPSAPASGGDPIDGYLLIDDTTAQITCIGLPFMD